MPHQNASHEENQHVMYVHLRMTLKPNSQAMHVQDSGKSWHSLADIIDWPFENKNSQYIVIYQNRYVCDNIADLVNLVTVIILFARWFFYYSR